MRSWKHMESSMTFFTADKKPPKLAWYNAARQGISDARTIDEVLAIHARAEAVRAGARRAKHLQLELDAEEIGIRAERRLGQLLYGEGGTAGEANGKRRARREPARPAPTAPPLLA